MKQVELNRECVHLILIALRSYNLQSEKFHANGAQQMNCSIRSVHLRGTCDLALLIVMAFGISQDYYRNSISNLHTI